MRVGDTMSIGRPTKFSKKIIPQVYELCLLGATDAELAVFFNISESTLNTWKKKHPDFLESLKRGKDIADARVANSLFQRAIGFEGTETKVATFEGTISDVQEVPKNYPPDTTAAIFWLKNRQAQKWRDKTDHNIKLSSAEEFLDAIKPTTGLPRDRDS